jgi:short-subunit dehydrogenase
MLAVITGASSGIGKELAYRLAEKNYDLVLVARREDRLKEIKKDLEKHDIKINLKVYDIQNINSCEKLMSELKDSKIDLFINNAGFGLYGETLEIQTSKEFDMIDLNIKSLQYLTKEVIKHMETGQIINLSSMAAFLPTPFLSSYAASKAYVYSYSQALRYELKRKKIPINVMTVCPGPVITEFNEVANASPKMKGLTVKKCVDSIIKGIEKKKALVIPGLKMKILKFLLRFAPNCLVLKVSYRVQQNK